jgi:hypothetical protein
MSILILIHRSAQLGPSALWVTAEVLTGRGLIYMYSSGARKSWSPVKWWWSSAVVNT